MAELEPDRYRLSDEERDEALVHLRTAFQEGRLGIDEHEERTDRALQAVTNGDLVPLFDDLPRALRPDSLTGGAGKGSAAPDPAPVAHSADPPEPAEAADGRAPEPRDHGANIGGLFGWGGFLLLVWGVPVFVNGSLIPIAIFLGFFCLMVVGPLAGQLAYNRHRRLQGGGGPGRISEG